KTPASVGGGFQRAVKSSMDSANIQRGLNPPLNEVSFKRTKGDNPADLFGQKDMSPFPGSNIFHAFRNFQPGPAPT
ncbi:MAG: hypothetical protein AB1815_04480, partial [Bacillota bacterium]